MDRSAEGPRLRLEGLQLGEPTGAAGLGSPTPLRLATANKAHASSAAVVPTASPSAAGSVRGTEDGRGATGLELRERRPPEGFGAAGRRPGLGGGAGTAGATARARTVAYASPTGRMAGMLWVSPTLVSRGAIQSAGGTPQKWWHMFCLGRMVPPNQRKPRKEAQYSPFQG